MPKKWGNDVPASPMILDLPKAFNRIARAADAEADAVLLKDRAMRAAREARERNDA